MVEGNRSRVRVKCRGSKNLVEGQRFTFLLETFYGGGAV